MKLNLEGLYLFDYDKTVAPQGEGVAQSILDAKSKVESNGGRYSLVTANPWALLREKYQKYNGRSPGSFASAGTPLAISMGSNIVNSEGVSLVSRHLHRLELEQIVETIPMLHTPFIAYTHLDEQRMEHIRIWFPQGDDELCGKLNAYYGSISTIWGGTLDELYKDMHSHEAMMITTQPSRTVGVSDILNRGNTVTSVNHVTNVNGFTEITTAGVSKESAVMEISGLTGERIFCLAEDDLAGMYMLAADAQLKIFVQGSCGDSGFVPRGAISVQSPHHLGLYLQELHS